MTCSTRHRWLQCHGDADHPGTAGVADGSGRGVQAVWNALVGLGQCDIAGSISILASSVVLVCANLLRRPRRVVDADFFPVAGAGFSFRRRGGHRRLQSRGDHLVLVCLRHASGESREMVFASGSVGQLVAVSKLPFFMATGLAGFFLLLSAGGFKLRPLVGLAGVAVVAGILFLLWTRYTDAAQAGAEFKFVDLRVAKDNPQMLFWYFGHWHYRLNPGNWVKAGWRFATAEFGSFRLSFCLFMGSRDGGCIRPQSFYWRAHF